MTGQEVPQEITARLTADAIIKSSLRSVIWFGSVRNNQDVHERSDCDLQIVLDKPSYELIVAVNAILEDYPSVDLSIMYMQDIYNHAGDVPVDLAPRLFAKRADIEHALLRALRHLFSAALDENSVGCDVPAE